MAKPTPKSPRLNKLLSSLAGRDREQTIRDDLCIRCGMEARTFRDGLSVKEYSISGLCQLCQDVVFG